MANWAVQGFGGGPFLALANGDGRMYVAEPFLFIGSSRGGARFPAMRLDLRPFFYTIDSAGTAFGELGVRVVAGGARRRTLPQQRRRGFGQLRRSAAVTLVNPRRLWFQANVPEEQVSRIKPGQRVTIHLDECGQSFPGLTVSLVPATASFLDGLSLDNATVTFSKVAQTVSVKIMPLALPAGCRLLPGLSAEVSINTAG